MSDEDVEYFYRRAEEELAMAQKAELRSAVKAHYQLASAYLERLPGGERPALVVS